MKAKMFLLSVVGVVCACGFAEEVRGGDKVTVGGVDMTARPVRMTAETLEKKES